MQVIYIIYNTQKKTQLKLLIFNTQHFYCIPLFYSCCKTSLIFLTLTVCYLILMFFVVILSISNVFSRIFASKKSHTAQFFFEKLVRYILFLYFGQYFQKIPVSVVYRRPFTLLTWFRDQYTYIAAIYIVSHPGSCYRHIRDVLCQLFLALIN